ncbi:MAG: hypothetical protein QM607_09280, partial [Microbacterium sp.]
MIRPTLRTRLRALASVAVCVFALTVAFSESAAAAASGAIPSRIISAAAMKTAYPSASTTGVPSNIKLSTHDGNIVITKANTILTGLLIKGTVTVKASGVLIKNCKIVGGKTPGNSGLVNNLSTGSKFTIVDSELVPQVSSTLWNGIMGKNFTATRVNIHGVVDAIHLTGGNVTIQNSFLHDTKHLEKDPLRDYTP